LSGHCYPIRPIPALLEELGQFPDQDRMQMVRLGPESDLMNNVARRWHKAPLLPDDLNARIPALARIDHGLRRILDRVAREFPRDFRREIAPHQLWFGSQWWAMTPPTLDALLAESAKSQWTQAFRSTYAPDELYFTTLVAATHRAGKQLGSGDDMGQATLQGAPLHFITPTATRWFEDGPDARSQLQTCGKFFVRKVVSEQGELLDWIDRELLGLENE
jgi:hypothetical protein